MPDAAPPKSAIFTMDAKAAQFLKRASEALRREPMKNESNPIESFINVDKPELRDLVTLATEQFASLLSRHIPAIEDVSHDEDADGQVTVAFSLKLDFTHKAPCGGLAISFARKTKDEGTFAVQDRAQGELEMEGREP